MGNPKVMASFCVTNDIKQLGVRVIIDGSDGIDYNMDRHLRLRSESCHVGPDSSLLKDIDECSPNEFYAWQPFSSRISLTSLLAFSQVAVPFSSSSSCHDCSSAPGAGLPSSPCCHNSIHDSRTKSHR